MKNQKKLLEDMKKQITDINYYLKNVRVIPNDRKSVANYNNAVALAENLNKTINDNVWAAEKKERAEKSKQTDEAYQKTIASTNSPTPQMVKDAEANMAVKNGYMNGGLNIIKQAVELMKKKAAQHGSELQKKANNPKKDA